MHLALNQFAARFQFLEIFIFAISKVKVDFYKEVYRKQG
jgi:hypothetical protein